MKIAFGVSDDVLGLKHRLLTSYGCIEDPESVVRIDDPQPITVVPKDQDPEYCFVTTYADGQFGNQLALQIPMTGSMSGGMGINVCSGCATRYIQPSNLQTCLEHTPNIADTLGEYRGFVSWAFSSTHDFLWATKGVQYYGLYSLLSTLNPELLIPWIENPMSVRFVEAWSGALLVSRYPWPVFKNTEVETMVNLSGLSTQQHFWRFDVESRSRRYYETNRTSIGVSTGWSTRRFYDAVDHVMMSAIGLEVINKQCRNDMVRTIMDTWSYIKDVFVSDQPQPTHTTVQNPQQLQTQKPSEGDSP